MSHFTVTICLTADEANEGYGIQEALEAKLAPFDENTRVEPYPDYEKDAPVEFWWVKSVRQGAEHHRNGTGLRPYDPKAIGYSSHGPVKKTHDEQRAEFAEDATWAERLGDLPTWAEVAAAYNEKWGHDKAVALQDDDDINTEKIHVDDEGRAFTWTTYNPDSKWDWWTIGGRWQRHFKAIPEADRELLVFGQSGSFGDNRRPTQSTDGSIYCDGGPVALLDFEGMRAEAAAEQLKDFDRWAALVAEHGEPDSWERLASLAELGEITWDLARERYNSQPIIKAAERAELRGFMGPSPEAHFGTTREEFERRARAGAVPGYALITLNGEWTAPGRMGWFGMSSDGPGEADAFKVAASKYLDELPADAWLVQVDCHI